MHKIQTHFVFQPVLPVPALHCHERHAVRGGHDVRRFMHKIQTHFVFQPVLPVPALHCHERHAVRGGQHLQQAGATRHIILTQGIL
jgi:hypothetical protein